MSLLDFIRESNRIEGIHREPSMGEIAAHHTLLQLSELSVTAVKAFVQVIAPGKPIRSREGMDVTVGQHVPPPGGEDVLRQLRNLISHINARTKPVVLGVGRYTPEMAPYLGHQLYETLHPFMDGNGRSGRAIWLWHMGGLERAPLGFLHHWYYQSLQAAR